MGRSSRHFVLCMVIVLGSTLLLIESANAQINLVNTYCDIVVGHVVEGQPVVATIQMSPATPTGEGYRIFAWVTSPNGVGDKELNGAWVKNVLTDANGKVTVTFNVPTYAGKWYVDVSFGGTNFENHTILYSGGDWRTEFTVSSANTPTPTITPTPESVVTSTSTPATSPTVPELSLIAVLALMMTVPLALLILTRKDCHAKINKI